MALNTNRRPVPAPAKVWVVLKADGERHFIEKELLGGMEEWAKGQLGVTIVEYEFRRVVYHADPPDPDAPKK